MKHDCEVLEGTQEVRQAEFEAAMAQVQDGKPSRVMHKGRLLILETEGDVRRVYPGLRVRPRRRV